MLTGKNGILTEADNAKMETIVATVKENLNLEQIEKAIEEKEVTPETLLAEGRVKRTVQQAEDGKYYMHYVLKADAVDGMQGLGKGNIASLKDVFIIDDKLGVKYIGKNGKEYGDNIEEKILEDETKIRFSSKGFSEYVSKISGVTEEEMKFKWMKNQTSLTIADSSVDSLEDLVFFPNLTRLILGETGNKNIPPITTMDGIENCTKLTNLVIYFGPDKDYSAISQLNNLTAFLRWGGGDFNEIVENLKFCENLSNFEIQFSNEKIDMKILTMLKNLEYITLTNSQIDKIEGLDNLSSLTRINLGSNQITKIEGLQNLTNLETLYLNNNKIIKIEGLENLSKLKTLNLSHNQIIDITPLSANSSSLIDLDLRGNPKIDGNRNNYNTEELLKLDKIGEIIDRNGRFYLDLEQLSLFTNYKKLDLSFQNLTTLDRLEGMKQLEDLNLGTNQLTLEDAKSQEILSSMKNLKSLYLTNNRLTDISAINNLKNLKVLDLQGNENIDLSEIEDIISNLNNLRIGTEALKTIENCSSEKIQKLNIDYSTSVTEIPDLSKFTNLKTLSLQSLNNVKDFSVVSNFSSVVNLYLTTNDLRNKVPNFSKLTNLQTFSLSNCSLWSEDLENLKALKNNTNLTLDLSNNAIIDASALLVLNPNTKINLKGNINLSEELKTALSNHFKSNVTF